MSGQSLSASCWSGQGSWEGARLSEDPLHTNKNTHMHTHAHNEMWMCAGVIWTCTTFGPYLRKCTQQTPTDSHTRFTHTHTHTNAFKCCILVCNDKDTAVANIAEKYWRCWSNSNQVIFKHQPPLSEQRETWGTTSLRRDWDRGLKC